MTTKKHNLTQYNFIFHYVHNNILYVYHAYSSSLTSKVIIDNFDVTQGFLFYI